MGNNFDGYLSFTFLVYWTQHLSFIFSALVLYVQLQVENWSQLARMICSVATVEFGRKI